MATFLTEDCTKAVLDAKMNGVYMLEGGSELVLFTAPPTKVGTDGTEVAGGDYARVTIPVGSAVAGSAGRTGQNVSTGGLLFSNMPVDNTDVVGYGYADTITHDIWFVNDSWTPAATFGIGDDYLIPAAALVTFGIN